MDYKKEYKKIKAEIKAAYLFAQTDSTKAGLEHILPELRESEDEKVRKWLINLLDEMQYHHCDNEREMGNKALAWLENIPYTIDREKRKGFHLGYKAGLEKQELKSNPYSGVSFEYNGHTWGMCARDNGVDILFDKKLIQHISDGKQGEQKPAWSKEDKRMMDLNISVFEVNHPKSIFKDGLRAVYTDDIVSWLKSIQDRMKGE